MQTGTRYNSAQELTQATGNDRNPVVGTFANFILMKGDISLHIPDSMSFEDAATLPCGIGTVGLAFYRYLELPFVSLPIPEKKSESEGGRERFILIYGGSSATGSLAIQFAKLYVYFPPLTLCFRFLTYMVLVPLLFPISLQFAVKMCIVYREGLIPDFASEKISDMD